ncbi:hypothetical protein BVRB_029570 [Beta vulgaris subsp. vulgaris]|uniref:Uncharacterized protein n=1 Tax=Beta vulgaris subsp. vulgaris TaxID=3555 RepID=A0A0J8B162_BETVV|nr:hypothetical protein BVRB_029570 [Beta vulgaris subsp. vulgaris]
MLPVAKPMPKRRLPALCCSVETPIVMLRPKIEDSDIASVRDALIAMKLKPDWHSICLSYMLYYDDSMANIRANVPRSYRNRTPSQKIVHYRFSKWNGSRQHSMARSDESRQHSMARSDESR